MKESIKCIDCISKKTVQLELETDTIQSLKESNHKPRENIFIGPGLTDIQVNGFAGIDFNTFPIEEQGMLTAIQALIGEGVTSFFPTVITNSDQSTSSLLSNLDRLCQQNPLIDQYIGGLHLEGPFLSPVDGAKGAHDSRYIKAPDWNLFQQFQEAAGGRIKIVTLCPDWAQALPFIEKCVNENIIVAIGHTHADPERIKLAIESGASMSTHLGNGAPLMLPRNSNFIIEQLAHDQLAASLIADGFHVPDSFLKVALKMKGDRALLVSDSTMFAGMEPGTYDSHIGGKVVLEKSGRLSTFKNKKILAGAALSSLDGINKLLKSNLADLAHAWALASINPNKLIGKYENEISSPGASDLVLFRLNNNAIHITDVFKMGKRVYSEPEQ